MYSVLFWLLANPLAVLLALMGLGLANLWRTRRDGRLQLLAVTVPFVLLVLFATPAFIHLLRGILEWQYPPLETRPDGIQAIVVLSSRIEPNEEASGGLALDSYSRSRCECAAKMYRLGERCPILVTGGPAKPNEPACAVYMRDFLLKHGIPDGDIIVETKSTSTYENAIECRQILRARGLTSVLLVTDGGHMLRAEKCFKKQGIDVVPCSCHALSTTVNPGRLVFWPHPKALQSCPLVCYEWLALPWYWIRRWI